ncbi:MAG: DUF4082 domain-containing protein [Rhodospirillales bacterium]|nr:DUF4082 domain-containing protein [Rhodospirillales bacterium]
MTMKIYLVPLGALAVAAAIAAAPSPSLSAAKVPIAVDDLQSTTINTTLTLTPGQLIANDTRTGHLLRVVSVGHAVNGTVSLATSGRITFTPAQDSVADARFDYTIEDASTSAQSTATVYIAIAQTPLTIWQSSATPSVITDPDTSSVELGVKFYSDVAGQVLGLRFYKGPQNTGSHPVSLWTSTGTKLATATSADETASGWQEVRFTQPVAISSGKTYVASYHSAGHYSTTPSYFANWASNGALHAPASSATGGNGVYRYGSNVQFPNATWQASNYWVDVVFQAGTPTADTTPPTTPSNFTATPAANRVDLAWSASTDDTSSVLYKLTRNGAALTTTSATTYSDSGLAAATTYSYGLTAYDDAGNASATVTKSATTPSSAPVTCAVNLGAGASLGGKLPFPADNPWNQDISTAAVDPNSSTILNTTNFSTRLHADFGSGTYGGTKIGVPYIVVPENQPLVPIDFTAWPLESDAGPYPFPPNAPIEGLGATSYMDRHVLVIQRDCAKPTQFGKLFETFGTYPVGNYPTSVSSWRASNGAVFDLNSNALRPAGWTSADAAGLPIFPGLVRYDEVAAGEIRHALRFTLAPGYTRKAYIAPARHWASSNTGSQYAPFGMRVRLKAGVDISYLPHDVQVIARAMKKYGMLLADNGGNWFVSGAPDERWDNDELAWLGQLAASNFEVVKMGTIVTP